MSERSDVMTSDGLPRLGKQYGRCNHLPHPDALVRCELLAAHDGPHSGNCGWGASTWPAVNNVSGRTPQCDGCASAASTRKVTLQKFAVFFCDGCYTLIQQRPRDSA